MAFGNRDGEEPAAGPAAPERTNTLPPPALEGERGIPAVNPRSYQSRGQLVFMSAGILLLLGLLWAINRSPPQPMVAANDPMATKDQRFDEGRAGNRDLAPVIPKAPPVAASPFEPPKPPAPLVSPIAIVPKIDPGHAPAAAQTQRTLTPLEKRMRSKTTIQGGATGSGARETYGEFPAGLEGIPGLAGLMRNGSVMPVQATAEPARTSAIPALGVGAPGPALAAGQGGVQPSLSDEGSLAIILRPTRLQGVAATAFPNRQLMMAQGKMIDCVLDTAISTVVAGMVRCSLTRDVYGEDGKVVLLDRGTEMTGEYRSNMRTGQSRLGIVWNRAKTPRGAVIELVSPASDQLGRAGVDGYVDTHFWDRYGAAILLSTLDDALTIFANRQRDAGTLFIPPNTTRTGREAAAVALEQNIRIPPTIIKNQGEAITIFVARDLDFRTVYTYSGTL